MPHQKISFLIFNYNQSKYLNEIFGAILQQTQAPDEVILIDDASTDNSVEMILDFQKKNPNVRTIFNSSNKGFHYNVNYAASVAKGDYITITAADDLLLPLYVEKCRELLDKEDKLGIIFSNPFIFEDKKPYQFDRYSFLPGIASRAISTRELIGILQTTEFFIPSWTSIYRRELFIRYGGYQASLMGLTDYLINYQIALRHPIGFIPMSLGAYRIVAHSYGSKMRKDFKKRYITIRNLLQFIENSTDEAFKKKFLDSKILRYNGLFLILYLLLHPTRYHLLFPILKKSWRTLALKLGRKLLRKKSPPVPFSPIETIATLPGLEKILHPP